MIHAYRGEPFRYTHENEAFDALLEQLQVVWGDVEDNCYLFGNFMCNGREIDAAFLKRNAFTLIDFKNFAGNVEFSENNVWYADKVPVKGGNNINPFRQMRENKWGAVIAHLDQLGELPSKRLQTYAHVSGLVVFHSGPITFDETKVPRKIASWFKVADLESAVTRLDQIGSTELAFSDVDMEYICESLDVPSYLPVRAKLRARSAAVATAPEPEVTSQQPTEAGQFVLDSSHLASAAGSTPEEKDAWATRQAWCAVFDEFLRSEERVLIISGTYGTGCEQALSDAAKAVVRSKLTSTALAPNRRLADGRSCDLDVTSIYRYIYGGSAEAVGSQLIYPYAKNGDGDRHVYIVCDAHLVSDSHFETELFRYGSGQLLTDLMTYVGLDSSQRKIIFIGDPWQLTRGNDEDAAMSMERVEAVVGVKPRRHEVRDLAPHNLDDPCVELSRDLVTSLEARRFNHLVIRDRSPRLVLPPESPEMRGNAVRDGFINDPSGTKFVAFSHDQVNTFNRWIRLEAFSRTGPMQPHDIMQLHNGFVLDDETGMDDAIVVKSGSFLKVLEVLEETHIEQPLKGRSDPVRLSFVEVRASLLEQGESVRFLCLKDFPQGARPELETDTALALRVNAEGRLQAKLKKTVFSPDPDAAHRQQAKARADFMRTDKYLNAAQLRFGYALTLHRAQGMTFPLVYVNLDTGQGQFNESYFRWVYTALTVSEEQLVAINPPRITPLSRAKWRLPKQVSADVAPSNLVPFDADLPGEADPDFPSLPIANLFRYVKAEVLKRGITVAIRGRHSYQEVYEFSNDQGNHCIVRFHYDGKHHVTRLQSVDAHPPEFFEEVQEAVTGYITPMQGFSAELHSWLRELFAQSHFDILSIEHHAYQDVYYLGSAHGRVKLQIHYSGDGFVSHFTPAAYSSPAALPRLKEILGVNG